MIKRPKRRRSKDNPYILDYDDKLDIYTVSFKNSDYKKIQISSDVYRALDSFELDDLSFMNEYDRHIEHLEVSFDRIYFDKNEIEDAILNKVINEELYKEINKLPVIQGRRLKMYFFNHMTLQQIAELENCTFRAVKFSIDIALKRLSQSENLREFIN